MEFRVARVVVATSPRNRFRPTKVSRFEVRKWARNQPPWLPLPLLDRAALCSLRMAEEVGSNPQGRYRVGRTTIVVGIVCVTLVGFAARHHFARPAEGPELARATAAVVARLRSGHAAWADEVSRASRQNACDGAERAAIRGLDADQGTTVLPLLERATRSCRKLPFALGLHAEALARSGNLGADADASRALAANPSDPYALYAGALLAWRAKRPDASELAEQAVGAHRGASAQLLKGLIAYDAGKLDSAEQAFRAALAEDPSNVEAVYDLALVEHRAQRYLPAREGYLRVLKLAPDHADARFNLALLAHSIGAEAEARHHLEKLRSSSKDAAQVARLEAALAEDPSAPKVATSRHYSLSIAASAASANGPITESARSPKR